MQSESVRDFCGRLSDHSEEIDMTSDTEAEGPTSSGDLFTTSDTSSNKIGTCSEMFQLGAKSESG